MDALVVQWKLGGRPVAEFGEVQSYFRTGASLSLEGLRVGNASLLLPRVGGTDAGLYTCSIIHSPSRESRQVELRVEAPPRVSVSGTVVRAGEHSTVTCSVNSFYPESVNVTWLRDKQVVGGPETPLAQPGPDGLYSATSLLQLVPSISHADANYSCRVQHITLGAPIQEPFRLSVLSQPRLTLLQPLVTLEGQVTLQCLVSGYHPPDITVQWLRDGDPLVTMESSPTKETDGSFAFRSSYILNHPESNAQANFACRVQHSALSTPLESTATWTVPTCTKTCLRVIGLILLVLLLLLATWIVYQCCNISISQIHVRECFPEGSVTMLLCEAEGRLRDTDSLTWRSLRLGKELGSGQPGELSALMPKPEQHHVVTWRHRLGLGRQRLTSVLTIQSPRDKESFSCTFRLGARDMQQTQITIPGVAAVPQAPVLGEISRLQVLAPGEPVTLSCQISRFYPKELSVTWHRRGRGEPAFRSLDNLHTHKIDTPDPIDRKSYSVTSQLRFTPMVPEDEGAEYRCYVEHETLKTAEEKSTGPLELRGCPLLDGDMAIF
ncbi:tyrosine-protein phosphatase non-receptor type substrate 1-like isoform X2 [Gopherus flavomarginatus]|nr:tyrosine-protein phosphatase non-receptor type substrate 1-like isoform X2 [Gopherus flavomarginatus]